jgi:O-antigen ligase
MSDIASSSWWTSRAAQRLHLLVAVAAVLFLLPLAREEDLTWLAGLLLVLPALLLTFLRWPSGALWILISFSAMPVFFIEIFGWKARPEHFAAGIVLLAVGVSFLTYKKSMKFHTLDYWILAFIAVNFVSSTFGSSAPSSTLRWALQNTLAILPYFLVRQLIPDSQTLEKAFRILLAVGLAESLYGIFCALSHYAFGTQAGMSIDQYLFSVAAPYGSMYEPNLFGAYTACCAILFLATFLAGRYRNASGIGFLIASLAAVLSYSRAALLSFIVVCIWVCWKNRHSWFAGRTRLFGPVFVFAIACLLAVSTAGDVLRERFSDLYYGGARDETAMVRVLILQDALQEIPSHPWLGTGTASFNLTFDWTRYIPEWASEKTWIGNAPIRILHDTGVIGLVVFFGFFILVWRKARPMLKGAQTRHGMLLGLVGGALLYGVSFQFTDGTILAFFWVHLGFLASAVILNNANAPSTVAPSIH